MKSRYFVGAALVAMLAAGTSAQAQTTPAAAISAPVTASDAATQSDQPAEPQQGGDIVVTAQRRSESLQKVPIAISAISQDDLAKRGIVSTAQLTGTVPSLQVNSPYGDAQPNFTIRGIGVANEHNPNPTFPK